MLLAFLRRGLWIAALCVASCDREPSPPPTPVAPPAAVASVAPAAASGDPASDDEPKKRRFPEATVYVDGRIVASVKYLELPQKLPVRWKALDTGDRVVRRYRLAEYLEALGVDLAAVRQVHIHGGRGRVSIVDGAELARVREKLLFSFTQSERGKPRMHYPNDGMAVNTHVDMISNIAVYVQKPPPAYDGKKHVLSFEDGRPIEGVPYAEREREGGTRIYLDGALMGAIKRKSLPDSVVVPGSAEAGLTRYHLLKVLERAKIDPTAVRAVELVSDDTVAATLDQKAFAERAPGMLFTLPKRNRGRIQLAELPEDLSKLDAVLVYASAPLPDRAAQAKAPGSSGDQVNPKSRVISSKAVSGTTSAP
jgi:hypothetical protein